MTPDEAIYARQLRGAERDLFMALKSLSMVYQGDNVYIVNVLSTFYTLVQLKQRKPCPANKT